MGRRCCTRPPSCVAGTTRPGCAPSPPRMPGSASVTGSRQASPKRSSLASSRPTTSTSSWPRSRPGTGSARRCGAGWPSASSGRSTARWSSAARASYARHLRPRFRRGPPWPTPRSPRCSVRWWRLGSRPSPAGWTTPPTQPGGSPTPLPSTSRRPSPAGQAAVSTVASSAGCRSRWRSTGARYRPPAGSWSWAPTGGAPTPHYR